MTRSVVYDGGNPTHYTLSGLCDALANPQSCLWLDGQPLGEIVHAPTDPRRVLNKLRDRSRADEWHAILRNRAANQSMGYADVAKLLPDEFLQHYKGKRPARSSEFLLAGKLFLPNHSSWEAWFAILQDGTILTVTLGG